MRHSVPPFVSVFVSVFVSLSPNRFPQVRGYSVVIGAVEAAITEHPLVSTSVVLTEGAEGSMDKKLVAYIVPAMWHKVRAMGEVTCLSVS